MYKGTYMTVKELMEKMSVLPPDLEVKIYSDGYAPGKVVVIGKAKTIAHSYLKTDATPGKRCYEIVLLSHHLDEEDAASVAAKSMTV